MKWKKVIKQQRSWFIYTPDTLKTEKTGSSVFSSMLLYEAPKVETL